MASARRCGRRTLGESRGCWCAAACRHAVHPEHSVARCVLCCSLACCLREACLAPLDALQLLIHSTSSCLACCRTDAAARLVMSHRSLRPVLPCRCNVGHTAVSAATSTAAWHPAAAAPGPGLPLRAARRWTSAFPHQPGPCCRRPGRGWGRRQEQTAAPCGRLCRQPQR